MTFPGAVKIIMTLLQMQAGRHGITDVLSSREGQCLQEITDAAAGDRYRVHLAEAEPILALYQEP